MSIPGGTGCPHRPNGAQHRDPASRKPSPRVGTGKADCDESTDIHGRSERTRCSYTDRQGVEGEPHRLRGTLGAKTGGQRERREMSRWPLPRGSALCSHSRRLVGRRRAVHDDARSVAAGADYHLPAPNPSLPRPRFKPRCARHSLTWTNLLKSAEQLRLWAQERTSTNADELGPAKALLLII